MKANFDYFQIEKSLLQTNGTETVNEKMGSFVKIQCFLLKYGL